MSDFRISSGSFSSTEVTVSPISQDAKDLFWQMFGQGCSSVNMPKSKAQDFGVYVSRKAGLTCC